MAGHASACCRHHGPPVNTSPPVISGTPTVGSTLHVSTGTWTTGARATTMNFAAVKKPAVIVAASLAVLAGAGTVASQYACGCTAPSPEAKAWPSVSGSTTVGGTASASTGTWVSSGDLASLSNSYAYQWKTCSSPTDSSTCSNSTGAGATTSSYTVAAGGAGDYLRAQVTATNAGGSTAQLSAATALITSGGSLPVNTAPPQISGVPMPAASTSITGAAGTVSASNGSWTNSPSSYSYQWQHCDATGSSCANETDSSATTATYTVQPADTNKTLKAIVTAHNASGDGSASAVTGPAPMLFSRAGVAGTTSTTEANVYQISQENPRGDSASNVAADHAANPNVKIIFYRLLHKLQSHHRAGRCRLLPERQRIPRVCSARDRQHEPVRASRRRHLPLVPVYRHRPEYPIPDIRPRLRRISNGLRQQRLSDRVPQLRTAIPNGVGGDGLFNDDLFYWTTSDACGQAVCPVYHATTPGHGTYANSTDWDNSYVSFFTAQAASLHANGQISVVNASFTFYDPTGYHNLLDVIDGNHEENWMPAQNAGYDGIFGKQQGYEQNYSEQNHKWLLINEGYFQSGTPTAYEYYVAFGLAGELLGANGYSLYNLGEDGTFSANGHPEYNTALQLGPGTGASTTSCGFAGGIASQCQKSTLTGFGSLQHASP